MIYINEIACSISMIASVAINSADVSHTSVSVSNAITYGPLTYIELITTYGIPGSREFANVIIVFCTTPGTQNTSITWAIFAAWPTTMICHHHCLSPSYCPTTLPFPCQIHRFKPTARLTRYQININPTKTTGFYIAYITEQNSTWRTNHGPS